jgi:Mrp family chromosome partitioning ATPase/capsular polysaccharide biosynthesis protein
MGCIMQPNDPPLQQYLNILKRQIAIVIMVPLIAITAANALVEAKDPVYRAAMALVAGEPSGGQRPPNLATTSVTRTFTTLLEGDYVSRNVIRKLKLDMTGKEFSKKLKVEVLPDTSVLQVTYDSTDAKQALAVVTEISRLFERRLGQSLGVSTGGTALPPTGSFELIVREFDPPHLQRDVVAPSRATTLVLAGIAGLVLGLMLAVARDSLDFRIRGGKNAEEWFGAPVVGALPERRGGPLLTAATGKRGSRLDEPHAQSLELLRARLQFSQMGIGGPTILVTSARQKDGKSSVTASLGVALARADTRVICVEADVRRPTLLPYLGVERPDGPGLVELLQGSARLEDALVEVDGLAAVPAGDTPDTNGWSPHGVVDPTSRLQVLPAGDTSGSFSGLFTASALSALIARLQEQADYVVFDSPPLMVADSFALARHSDSVLVVARRGRTTREQAEWARETLEGLWVQRVSVVLTNAARDEVYA